jgi:hypothetical protein
MIAVVFVFFVQSLLFCFVFGFALFAALSVSPHALHYCMYVLLLLPLLPLLLLLYCALVCVRGRLCNRA